MRHGRKSKTKRINGYKRHLAIDLDTGLIMACAVAPANRPELEAMRAIQADLVGADRDLGELHVDRGYIASDVIEEVIEQGSLVVCKPWVSKNGGLFTKADFKLDFQSMTVTCPANETQPLREGSTAEFGLETCGACPLRAKCTTSKTRGRAVRIADDEQLQQRLRQLTASPSGRQRLRERVHIEHSLAHLCRRQGPRARYRGTRKNLYDVRRAAAIQNLETVQRMLLQQAA